MNSELEKVDRFVNRFNLPKYIAEVLFEAWDDCITFMNNFMNKNKLIVDDLLDFREFKISSSNKSLDEFIGECKNNGLKSSFEKTFYQKFSDLDMSIIDNAIENGKISLEDLFYKFKSNHNKNILKYVL